MKKKNTEMAVPQSAHEMRKIHDNLLIIQAIYS